MAKKNSSAKPTKEVKEKQATPIAENAAQQTAGKKPIYKKAPFWIITAVVLVVVVLTMVTLLDYSIVSAGIKIACKPRKISQPDDYVAITEATEAKYDISYQSQYGNGYFDIYTPKNDSSRNPLVLYIHGGYYIGGDKKSAEPYCRTLAAEGYTVVSMNYGLAPKYKYPVQLKQVNEILGFLTKNCAEYKIDAEQIFIGGDSAGAHLSALAGAFYTNDELASKVNIERSIKGGAIKGLLLLCGFYDMDTVAECDFPFFDTAVWALTDVRNYKNYSRINELNIVANVTKSFPASFVVCGGDDPFYSQAEKLTEVLNEKRVNVVSYLPKAAASELKHEFQRDFSLAEAKEAMTKAIEFLKENTVGVRSEQEIHAIIRISGGAKFDVLLDPVNAPITVANFIAYAESGFYEGTVFHRILRNSVLQGGGYDIEYNDKEGTFEPIKGEFSANGVNYNKISHTVGVISMARLPSDFNSATSEFFFCAKDCSKDFDGQYAAFGRVVNIDGINKIVETTDVTKSEVTNPENPLVILSVTIEYRDVK